MKVSELFEGKKPTKVYGPPSAARRYEVEVYDPKKERGDVVIIRANSQTEVEDFCFSHGWEVQGLQLDEGVDAPRKRPQSMIQFGAKVAAEQLRKMGLSVRIDTRVVGRHEKSDRTVMTVNGDIDEADILKVLKKNKVEYATVGSQVKNGTKSRMIRLVQPKLQEGWKTGLAAAALSGAVVAGIANNMPNHDHGSQKPNASVIRIDGKIAQKAFGPVGPFAKETTVEIGGKPTKVKYWRSILANQRGMLVYKKLDEALSEGFADGDRVEVKASTGDNYGEPGRIQGGASNGRFKVIFGDGRSVDVPMSKLMKARKKDPLNLKRAAELVA